MLYCDGAVSVWGLRRAAGGGFVDSTVQTSLRVTACRHSVPRAASQRSNRVATVQDTP